MYALVVVIVRERLYIMIWAFYKCVIWHLFLYWFLYILDLTTTSKTYCYAVGDYRLTKYQISQCPSITNLTENNHQKSALNLVQKLLLLLSRTVEIYPGPSWIKDLNGVLNLKGI